MAAAKISSEAFYSEYFGHPVDLLRSLHRSLRNDDDERRRHRRGVLFLVGDSTLDNKHWFDAWADATNGYEDILEPARSKKDVTYHLNDGISRHGLGDRWVAINAAVEESTVGLRSTSPSASNDDNAGTGVGLLAHDDFVRNSITERDVLVVSCGGNDVALKPTIRTALSMFVMMKSPTWLIDRGLAPGMGHFFRLFGDYTKAYVESLVAKRKPRAVVVCMLYYLDEKSTGSWADKTLGALGYDRDPVKLQLVMRKLFEEATSRVKIDGVEVIPVPLYKALDGKDTGDYVERVEPSDQGGKKMADLLLDSLEPILRQDVVDDPGADTEQECLGTGNDNVNIVSMPSATHLRN